jgi:hypothetical protein
VLFGCGRCLDGNFGFRDCGRSRCCRFLSRCGNVRAATPTDAGGNFRGRGSRRFGRLGGLRGLCGLRRLRRSSGFGSGNFRGRTAILALPSCANACNLIVRQRARYTANGDVHLTQETHHLVSGNPQLRCHLGNALAQTNPP